MELKYYLRGLGLGIVVTAIIMGIVSSRNREMTDEEIIARAKQLGMVEDRVLSEAASDDNEGSDNDSDVGENAVSNENAVDANETSAEGNLSNEPEGPTAANDASAAAVPDDEETGQEEARTETEGSEAQDLAEAQDAAETQEDPAEDSQADRESEDSNASVVITIGSGDGSYTVSKKLEDIGVVASASAFDTFLCGNGYDKKIRAGNYTIPAGAGEEQVARIITGLE